MRHSSAILSQTTVRLGELRFPASRVHIARTRLAYIHLDNLLHFAKIDRDGRIDGYIAAYLPDEVALLFLQRGEVTTAAAFTGSGRQVLPISTVLKRMRDEMERGEIAYVEAPLMQLAWMYESCLGEAVPRPIVANDPPRLFQALQHERYSGILELISDGRVNYFRLEEGRYATGFFSDKTEGMPIPKYVEGLFAPHADGERPSLAACAFPARTEIPPQAPPPLIECYRDLYQRIVESAERRVSGEARGRATKARDTLVGTHVALIALATPVEREPQPLVATPEELTAALADWTHRLLDELEIIAPGVAAEVLAEATREQRFMLQKAGYFSRLPWPVKW